MEDHEILKLVQVASEFVSFGIKSPTARQYKELYNQYRDSSFLREMVKNIAEGLGLAVLGANNERLYLTPMKGSAYAPKMSDLNILKDPSKRHFYGLILSGLAAMLYRDEEDFVDHNPRNGVSPREVDHWIRAHIETMDLDDTLVEGKQQVYRDYHTLKEDDGNPRSRSTSVSLVGQVLSFLKDQKFMVIQDDRYFATTLMTKQMSQLAQNEHFREILGGDKHT